MCGFAGGIEAARYGPLSTTIILARSILRHSDAFKIKSPSCGEIPACKPPPHSSVSLPALSHHLPIPAPHRHSAFPPLLLDASFAVPSTLRYDAASPLLGAPPDLPTHPHIDDIDTADVPSSPPSKRSATSLLLLHRPRHRGRLRRLVRHCPPLPPRRSQNAKAERPRPPSYAPPRSQNLADLQ